MPAERIGRHQQEDSNLLRKNYFPNKVTVPGGMGLLRDETPSLNEVKKRYLCGENHSKTGSQCP